MATPEAYDAIHDKLEFEWAETPLVFENDPLVDPSTQDPFVFVEIVGDLLEQDTFGAPGENEWVEEGAAYLHVMVPDSTGSREARAIGKRLINLFREAPIGTMHFGPMSIGAGDPGRHFPNFFAMTVTIGWSRRDTTGS